MKKLLKEYEIYYIYCMEHKICQWCGNKKTNELGLCLNCHKFPVKPNII